MEIIRYVREWDIKRFMEREINLGQLIKESTIDKEESYTSGYKFNVPIKIIILDKEQK